MKVFIKKKNNKSEVFIKKNNKSDNIKSANNFDEYDNFSDSTKLHLCQLQMIKKIFKRFSH